jgi:hypothetical protein
MNLRFSLSKMISKNLSGKSCRLLVKFLYHHNHGFHMISVHHARFALGRCSQCHDNSQSPPGSSSASNCTCNSGYSPPNGSAGGLACVACVPGTYKAEPGQAACNPCPTGTVSRALAATDSSVCRCCQSSVLNLKLRGNPHPCHKIFPRSCGIIRALAQIFPISTCALSSPECSFDDRIRSFCDLGKYSQANPTACIACQEGTYSSAAAIGPEACLPCAAGT